METPLPQSSRREDMIALLHELIAVLRGGERGYRRAAEDIEEDVFRSLLACYADQRAQFVTTLETLVERFGGVAAPRESMIGAIQRGWSDLVAALVPGGDKGVLEACARGEDAARRVYEDALKSPLPIDIKGILEQQLLNIREAQERLRSLRKVIG